MPSWEAVSLLFVTTQGERLLTATALIRILAAGCRSCSATPHAYEPGPLTSMAGFACWPVLVSAGGGTHRSMRSRTRAARWERRQFRRLSKDLSTIPGFGDPHRPPRHRAKDVLGAVVTLAIIGAILLEVTNSLASRCVAEVNPRAAPGACSGVAAMAYHAQGVVTLSVTACAALAVIAFIWYMFWGYKANGQAGGTEQTSGHQSRT